MRFILHILLPLVSARCPIDFQTLCRTSELELAEIQSALRVVFDASHQTDAAVLVQNTLDITQRSLENVARICR